MSTSTAASEGARPGERPGWLSRSWIPRTIIIVAVLLPLIVALTYMWAMWDPTKYLPEVKLAVVNEDVGADHRGQFKEVGNQVTENLLATDYLNFTETTAEEAEKGLMTGEYLFVVSIPEDFSKETVSVSTANPVQSNIHLSYNDFNGTNGSILTSGLVPQIEQAIQASVTETYATEALNGLNSLGEGFDRAADGATKLDDGMGQLQDGVVQASDGIVRLDDGAGQLNDGAAQLYAGTQELNTGVDELVVGAGRLDEGANQLSTGMGQLRDGTGQLADGARQIDDGVNQLTDLLIPLLSQVQGATPSLQQAIPVLRAAGLNAEADQIEGITGKLDPANPENMVAQLGKLRDGTGELYYNLSDPSAPYLSGVIQLQDGSQQLAAGTGELVGGVARLDDGAGRLNDGARQLSEGNRDLEGRHRPAS